AFFTLLYRERATLQLQIQPFQKQPPEALALKPDISRSPTWRRSGEPRKCSINCIGKAAMTLLRGERSEFGLRLRDAPEVLQRTMNEVATFHRIEAQFTRINGRGLKPHLREREKTTRRLQLQYPRTAVKLVRWKGWKHHIIRHDLFFD